MHTDENEDEGWKGGGRFLIKGTVSRDGFGFCGRKRIDLALNKGLKSLTTIFSAPPVKKK
jgi:hypothetical protein